MLRRNGSDLKEEIETEFVQNMVVYELMIKINEWTEVWHRANGMHVLQNKTFKEPRNSECSIDFDISNCFGSNK